MCVFANSATVVGPIPAGGVRLPLAWQGRSPMFKVMVALEALMSAHVQRDVEFEQGVGGAMTQLTAPTSHTRRPARSRTVIRS
jgi:hypothetical protein